MPKLSDEQQNSVRSLQAKAARISDVANEFRQSLARFIDRFGVHVGVALKAIDGLPEPGFGLTAGYDDFIVTFEHAQFDGEVVGAYRLYRRIYHPAEPKFAEFWNFSISSDGRGSWSIGGPWEWKTGVSADIASFLLRAQHEYFEAIKIG
ncbi:hypothetical protein KTF36_17785 [Burkholderia gladioli]|uniref:hypothetical protein n=1 Tax=Burkholderia gladioli TaxID=28095 RepID=UPI001C2372E3|nr:hypothetical protein [Burkholderia gladioli]MBU9643704.1 hypothetical protein [Burkholderia gladioli]